MYDLDYEIEIIFLPEFNYINRKGNKVFENKINVWYLGNSILEE